MRIVILGVLILLTFSCSGGGDSSSPDSANGAKPTRAQGSNEQLVFRMSDARRREVMEDGSISSYIKAVVADGEITFPEYEAAVLTMAKCVRDAGGFFFRSDEPRLSNRGLYTYSPGWSLGKPETRALVNDCVNTYVGVLDLFWKELVGPTKQEEQQAMREMADCLRQRGITHVPESLEPGDFQKLPSTMTSDKERALYGDCATLIEAKYGLIGFAPIIGD